MTDRDDPDLARPDGPAATETTDAESSSGLLVSRRTALVGGTLGVAGVLGIGALDPALALAATTGAATTALVPVPTTGTAPEQLRLAWGADPTTEVTVSWSTPGAAAMPAPTLAYSRSPIGARNSGTIVTLPTNASPLDLSVGPRTGPTATSFADGLSGQTTYHYHAPLTGLEPGVQYYYEVSDGAGTPSTAGGSFFTAPRGRSAYRFTAFGDIGTPYTNNPSGANWTESSDVSVYTANGVISPGDGNGPGLFHLMLGDLSYANVNPGSTPSVWRDYQVNVSPASANQPWMPIMGNHEVELGICSERGVAATGPFSGTYGGPYFNGPYGAGNYLARHLLPDNGLVNSDGDSLQGSFYSFQVGTVLFICLNTNDVALQNPQTVSTGASGKTPFSATYANNITLGGSAAAGTLPGVTQYLATGRLTPAAANAQLVPDTSSGTPHLQTVWLGQQLQAARAPGSDVDMIVVCEHHCALSSGPSNGCDLGIRATWLPLYDQYEVDLVIGGHDHDYEASYPVRGYDADLPGTTTVSFTDIFGNQYTAAGQPINTRRPTVVQTEPTPLSNGKNAWNTGGGTVYLQLGGAGAAAGKTPNLDTGTGLRQAMVWASDGGTVPTGSAVGTAATQNAKEDATWSRIYDSSSNYGYAVFDVDPGSGPGETTLTYQWFAITPPNTTGDQEPGVTTPVLYETAPNSGTLVTPTLPATPYEEFVFIRSMSGQVSIGGATSGAVAVGGTLTATPSGWASGGELRLSVAAQRHGDRRRDRRVLHDRRRGRRGSVDRDGHGQRPVLPDGQRDLDAGRRHRRRGWHDRHDRHDRHDEHHDRDDGHDRVHRKAGRRRRDAEPRLGRHLRHAEGRPGAHRERRGSRRRGHARVPVAARGRSDQRRDRGHLRARHGRRRPRDRGPGHRDRDRVHRHLTGLRHGHGAGRGVHQNRAADDPRGGRGRSHGHRQGRRLVAHAALQLPVDA